MERQLWKLHSSRGVTAVCTLAAPEDPTFPAKWIVTVTWNGKPGTRELCARMNDAVVSANRVRDKLRLRDWLAPALR